MDKRPIGDKKQRDIFIGLAVVYAFMVIVASVITASVRISKACLCCQNKQKNKCYNFCMICAPNKDESFWEKYSCISPNCQSCSYCQDLDADVDDNSQKCQCFKSCCKSIWCTTNEEEDYGKCYDCLVEKCKCCKGLWDCAFHPVVKATIAQLWLMVVGCTTAGITIGYFYGDNMNISTNNMNNNCGKEDNQESEYLTIIQIFILICVKLGYRFAESGTSLLSNFSDNSPKKVSGSLSQATMRALSIVPEIDIIYTIFSGAVNLTTDECRTRNYNVLWIVYGGILIILCMKFTDVFASEFISMKKHIADKYKEYKIYAGIYVGIAIFFGILGIGLLLVADNEQPLDCSPHFCTSNKTKQRENYRLRVGFLVVSFVCSCTIIIMGVICWFISLLDKDHTEPEAEVEHTHECMFH